MYTRQSRIGAYTPFERHTASRKKNDARARLHACFCRKTSARGAPSSMIERLERTEPLQNSRPSHGRFHQISKIKTSTNSISRLLLNNCYNFLNTCRNFSNVLETFQIFSQKILEHFVNISGNVLGIFYKLLQCSKHM